MRLDPEAGKLLAQQLMLLGNKLRRWSVRGLGFVTCSCETNWAGAALSAVGDQAVRGKTVVFIKADISHDLLN